MKFSKMIALAGMAAATVAFAAQDGQLLRRSLTPNTTDSYTIDTKVDQTVSSAATGDMAMSIDMKTSFQVKTGAVDTSGGTADVETVLSVDKMDVKSQMPAPPAPKEPISQKGKIDTRGRFTLSPPSSADTMAMMMTGAQSSTQSSMLIELPEKPVKIGDSWDMIIPKSLLTAPEDQKLTVKLTGDKTVDGHDVWVVSVTGDVKSQIDTSKISTSSSSGDSPLGNMKFLVKSQTQITGEGTIEKATGKTLSMTTTGKMKSTIEVTDMGLSLDSSGNFSSTLKIKA